MWGGHEEVPPAAATTAFVNGTTLPPHGMLPAAVEMTVFLLASVPAAFFIVAGPVRMCQIKRALAAQPINTLERCQLGLKFAKQDELDVSFGRYQAKIAVSIVAAAAYAVRLGLLYYYLHATTSLVPPNTLWYHVVDCGANTAAWILSAFVVYYEFNCLQKQNWLQLGFWWTATFLNIVAVVASAADIDTEREGNFLIGDLASRFFLLVPLTVMAILALFPRDIDKETLDRMRQIVESVATDVVDGSGKGGGHDDFGHTSFEYGTHEFDGGGGGDSRYAAMDDVVGEDRKSPPGSPGRRPGGGSGGGVGAGGGGRVTSWEEVDRNRRTLLTSKPVKVVRSNVLGALGFDDDDDDDDYGDGDDYDDDGARERGGGDNNTHTGTQSPHTRGGNRQSTKQQQPNQAGRFKSRGSDNNGDGGGDGGDSDDDDDDDSKWTKAKRPEGDVTSDVIRQLAVKLDGSFHKLRTSTTSGMTIPQSARARVTGNGFAANGEQPAISSSYDETGGGFRDFHAHQRPKALSSSYNERSTLRMGSSVDSTGRSGSFSRGYLRAGMTAHGRSTSRGDFDIEPGSSTSNAFDGPSSGGRSWGRSGGGGESLRAHMRTRQDNAHHGIAPPQGLYGISTTGEQERRATNRLKAASLQVSSAGQMWNSGSANNGTSPRGARPASRSTRPGDVYGRRSPRLSMGRTAVAAAAAAAAAHHSSSDEDASANASDSLLHSGPSRGSAHSRNGSMSGAELGAGAGGGRIPRTVSGGRSLSGGNSHHSASRSLSGGPSRRGGGALGSEGGAERGDEEENVASSLTRSSMSALAHRLSSRLPSAETANVCVSDIDQRVDGDGKKKYIVFKVVVTNTDTHATWALMKRYSDFRQFDKQLREHLKSKAPEQLKLLPTLPPKNHSIRGNMDVSPDGKGYRLLQERMIGLQRYLRGIHYDLLSKPLVLDEKSRHSLEGLRPFLDLEAVPAARLNIL